MKPTALKPAQLFFGTIAVVIASLVLLSWDVNRQAGQFQQEKEDSIPKADREKKVRDLDDVMEELNRIDLKEHMEMARIEIQEALKRLDKEKIQMQIDDAMRAVDMVKLEKEIKESLAKVDWDKIKLEMDKAREEMKELGPKLEKEMEKVREELKEIGPKLEKELAEAKVEIEKAKTEIKEYQEFVNGLEKDGLLNKKEDYTIKHKDGELLVNGKKVTPDIYNKYRNFLEKHKTISIEKSKDRFNVDKD